MRIGDTNVPFRIGLTGGIASGKSTVADMFAKLGASVIDTDIIARDIVRPGEPALDEIRRRFGAVVIDPSGSLHRAKLRKIIFSDDTARHDLEAILHPQIGAETRRQSDHARGPYHIIVVPLLFGSPLRDFVDRVLVIDCDEEVQVQRLLRRDAESVEQARRILASQCSRRERLSIADDVIQNDDTLLATRKHVATLDAKYRCLATPSQYRRE